MIKQDVCKFNKIEVILLFERVLNSCTCKIVKLRQGSGKDWQGMAVKAKGLKA